MKIKTALFVLILLIAGFPVRGQKLGVKDLPPQYRQWLTEEVVYIISPKERDVFLQLRTDLELDLKILGASGAEVWTHSETYPVEIPQNQLRDVLGKDYEIKVSMPVGPGAHTLNLSLKNTSDGSRAEAERKFEI
jgi:hypothetical protein